MSSLPINGLPANALALEPQSVRNGGTAAQNAYQEGLAFENVLVNELTQQLTQTIPGLGGAGSSSGGLGGSDSSSLGGSALGPYSSLLTQALGTGMMSGGGTGIAMQIARSLDPALAYPAPPAAAGSQPSHGSGAAGPQPPHGSGAAGATVPTGPSASGGASP